MDNVYLNPEMVVKISTYLDKGEVAYSGQRCSVDACCAVHIHSLAAGHQQVQQAHCLWQHQGLHVAMQ